MSTHGTGLPALPAPSPAVVCVAPAPLGDDAGDGSAAAPVATLARARARGRPTLLLAGGSYPGALVLGGAVALFGGLDPGAGWTRAGAASVFSGGSSNRALDIVAGAAVRLDGIEVAPTGAAWMGIHIAAGAEAWLTRCVLAGGVGRPGTPSALSCWGSVHVEACQLRGGPGDETSAICSFGRASIVDCDLEASHIGVNCSGATVERCRIRAGTYGVYIQGDDVSVRGCTITLEPRQPGARGVFIVNGERLTIEGNSIDGRPDHEQLGRWSYLLWCIWRYDEYSARDYSMVSITGNGLWFHGEAGGPSGGPYTGPTQDLDDLLVSPPVQPLPAALVDEIRSFLRAHLP